MFKLLIVGILGAAATGGGFYLSQMMAAEDAPEDGHPAHVMQQVSTEITAVPVVLDGRVSGYLVVRASSTIDTQHVDIPELLVVPYIADSVFRAAFEFARSGMREIRAAEVESFAKEVAKLANEKLGGDVVKAVNLEQFNFVDEAQIRGNRFKTD